MFKRYIGDRAFYRRIAGVAVPIVIQNTITNFVSLLDNIMVGQTSTVQMSGVAIVNQLMFIFNLCIFGAMAGAGIFTAQFHGSGDQDGIRRTFRFKFLAGLLLGVGGILLFKYAGSPLLSLYLQSDSDPTERAQTLHYGLEYLHVMLWGLVPFALANAYSSTLRETGQTKVPMTAGILAVLVNLCLNYVFIFGHFGAPAMGAKGAALATVISRYVEFAIVFGWTHLNPRHNPYIVGAYRSLYIPGSLLKKIFIKGMPLLINEFLFALGLAFVNQCYSVRSLDVLAATNISYTINNICSVAYLSLGNTIGIIMGQMMGSGSSKESVRDTFRKMTALSIASCGIFALVLLAISSLFPQLYNTSDAVRSLATQIIIIQALMMPFHGYIHAAYFAMRSGGKTLITFFFDSGYIWLVMVPLAFCLSRFTLIPVIWIFAICNGSEILKCVLGKFVMDKDSWIQDLTKL
jgi:putative MATE family efflux protein